jgi:hypothetical protein
MISNWFSVCCARAGFSFSRLAARPDNTYLKKMSSSWSKILIGALAMFAVGVGDTASAQRASSVPSIMVDVDEKGVPIIIKEPRARAKGPESEDGASKRAERPRKTRRGSSAYVEPIPLPNTSRASGIVAPPSVTPYNPPPISNPSERINQLNHSFPLNRGLGNNPTDRDAYIRYNLTR